MRGRACTGRRPPGTGCDDVPVTRIRWMFAAVAATALGVGPGTPGADAPEPAAPEERLLIAALDALRGGRIDAAVAMIEESLGHAPDFRLARLVYADLLAAKAGAPRGVRRPCAAAPQAQELRDEARKRIRRHSRRRRGRANTGGAAQGSRRISRSRSRWTSGPPLCTCSRTRGTVACACCPTTTVLYRQERRHEVARRRSAHSPSGSTSPPGGSGRRRSRISTGRARSPSTTRTNGIGASARTGYGIWIHGVPHGHLTHALRSPATAAWRCPNHHFTLLSDRLGTTAATPVVIGDDPWSGPAPGDVRRRRAGLDPRGSAPGRRIGRAGTRGVTPATTRASSAANPPATAPGSRASAGSMPRDAPPAAGIENRQPVRPPPASRVWSSRRSSRTVAGGSSAARTPQAAVLAARGGRGRGASCTRGRSSSAPSICAESRSRLARASPAPAPPAWSAELAPHRAAMRPSPRAARGAFGDPVRADSRLRHRPAPARGVHEAW